MGRGARERDGGVSVDFPVIRSVPTDRLLAAHPDARGAYVYRCFDSDRALLYIGSTKQVPRNRMYLHRTSRAWWPEVTLIEYEWVLSLKVARVYERVLIQEEAPRYNQQWNLGRGPRRHKAAA